MTQLKTIPEVLLYMQFCDIENMNRKAHLEEALKDLESIIDEIIGEDASDRDLTVQASMGYVELRLMNELREEQRIKANKALGRDN